MAKQQVALVSTIEGDHFVKLFDSEMEAVEWAVEWAVDNLTSPRGPIVDRDDIADLGMVNCLDAVCDWLGASEWLTVIPVTAAQATGGE